jgi:hypothetical protein
MQYHRLRDRSKYGEKAVYEYQTFLWMLLTTNRFMEPFVTKKIITLLVDVAKHSLPKYWDSFIFDIFNLQHTSIPLALDVLIITVEEFISARGVGHDQAILLKNEIETNIEPIVILAVRCLLNGYRILAGAPTADTVIVSPARAGTKVSAIMLPSPTSPVPRTPEDCLVMAKKSFELLHLLASSVKSDAVYSQQTAEAVLPFLQISSDDWRLFTLTFLTEFFSKKSLGTQGPFLIKGMMPPIVHYFKQFLDHITINGSDSVGDLCGKTVFLIQTLCNNHLELLAVVDPPCFTQFLKLLHDMTIIEVLIC